MPDEAQPLSAAQPDEPDHTAEEPAAAPAAPSEPAAEAKPAAPGKAESPAPPAKAPAPVAKPVVPAGAVSRSGGSSNRVRARLARLGVQRSSAYNPVLEPLLRIVRGNDPKIETATLRQVEQRLPGRRALAPRARSARAATRTSPTPSR